MANDGRVELQLFPWLVGHGSIESRRSCLLVAPPKRSIQRLNRESTERKACTNCGQTKDLADVDFEALRGVLSVSRGYSIPDQGKTGERGQD